MSTVLGRSFEYLQAPLVSAQAPVGSWWVFGIELCGSGAGRAGEEGKSWPEPLSSLPSWVGAERVMSEQGPCEKTVAQEPAFFCLSITRCS